MAEKSVKIFLDMNDKELIRTYLSYGGFKKGDALILEGIRSAAAEFDRIKKPLVFSCGNESCSVKILR